MLKYIFFFSWFTQLLCVTTTWMDSFFSFFLSNFVTKKRETIANTSKKNHSL
ncbi:hypothetical protein DM01DRAFT_306710 [Hesseltinella vesiculosa]|uniref:Uncharacterized protein n=1 Tax=Hesseltinella vesiculosa TaxID=101127 RepID=A0A1X2GJU0_9FUNG|nr:hypothetical protein DM01DRAFT_306710 [Hesseltinella vesiculosa]